MSAGKVVDLFSGCGGMSLGFQRAGYDVVAAYDVWDQAVEVYNRNLSAHAKKFDLADVEAAAAEVQSLGAVDGIVGGPPCQDFSTAGQRAEGDRAKLTEAFAKIITSVQPPWFVMENVPRARASSAWNLALEALSASGYRIEVVVEDAGEHGSPQTRRRVVAFGVLRELEGEEPEGAFLKSLRRQRGAPVSVRKYFGDSLGIEHYYRHPRSYDRRAIFSVDEQSPTVRGVNRPKPPGYRPHPGDSAPPEGVRALTSSERARIQTFPEWFEFPVAKTHAEQMIGNAVPPSLMEAVGLAVREATR